MSPMDPLDDDFRDSEISSLLGRVGGDAPATNAAYRHVLGRVRHVRRRRTIATTVGAGIMIVAVGTMVIQSSSRESDRIALEPGAAVVTTPDGSAVTTPDGVVVTVITEPSVGTTVPGAPGVSSVPGGSSVTSTPASGSNPSSPTNNGGVNTTAPSSNTSPNGTNRPAGSTDETTTTTTPPTTKPAPVTTAPPTTKPVAPSVPITARPTTPPVVPSVPVTARPTTPPAAPSVPVTAPPVTAPPATKPAPVTTAPAPPTTAPTDPNRTFYCGPGAVKIDIVDDSFVVASLRTVVVSGYNASVKSVKSKSIEVEFAPLKGKVVATLKVRITSKEIKDSCDIEVDKDSDGESVESVGPEDSSDPDRGSASGNNGGRADD